MILFCVPARAQTPATPAVAECEELPGIFVPQRQIRNETHRQVLSALGETRDFEKRARQAAALLEPMRALHMQAVQRGGAGSVEAGILQVDFANLLEAANRPARPEVAQAVQALRQEALLILQNATTSEGVEVWIGLHNRIGISGPNQQAIQIDVLNRFRRIAGDSVRAVPLWGAVLQGVTNNAAERERITREQLASAERSGSVSWRLAAQAERIEARLAVLAPRPPDQGDVIDSAALEAIRKMRAQAGDILEIARAMAPHFHDEGAPITEAQRTFCAARTGFTSYQRVILALGTREEAVRAFRVGVWRAVVNDPFGTDYAGAVDNLRPVLAARAIDPALYRRAMARIGIGTANRWCQTGHAAPELCAMATAAGALSGLGATGPALQVLRDAKELMSLPGMGLAERIGILLQLAELEWQSGSASDAPNLLAQAEVLLGDSKTFPGEQIRALRLRAIIADAQLDDAKAIEAFTTLVRLSVDWSRRGPREAIMPGQNAPKVDPVALEAHQAARDLVGQHIRRRFCADCGGAQPYLQPAIDWLLNLFDPSTPLSFIPEANDYLLTAAPPASVWPPEFAQKADNRFKDTAHLKTGQQRVDGSFDYSLLREMEQLSKVLPKNATLRTRLRVLALRMAFFDGAIGGTLQDSQAAGFVRILTERDLAQKRRLWKNFINPIADEQYSQFGNDRGLHEELDAFARNAMASGYMAVGRVVFEDMLDRISAGTSTGNPKDIEALASSGALAIGAIARLAAFALDNREWPLAHRLLDLASSLIQQRLKSEWQTGNERTVASMRQLRPAARLIAQLRARLVTQPESRATRPDGPDILLADLQLAMLGDTALASQIANRRRVIADADLSRLIRQRDDAQLELDGIRQMQWFYDQNGLVPVAEIQRRATQRRDEMAAEVNRKLPVPEDLVSPAPLPLAAVQRGLRPDEAMLVLHAGSDGVYGLLVRPEGRPLAWMNRIPLRDLEARIETIRSGLDLTSGVLPRFPFADAASLFDLLLGPAREALAGRKHLLVVSDGPLQSVPFSVLPMRAPVEAPITDEIRGARIDWLVRQHALTVLPSVRSIATRETQRLASRAQTAFAGIGDPVLTGAPGSVRSVDFRQAFQRNAIADVEALRRLPALPDTRLEVTRIAENLRARPQDMLLGAAASETAVKKHPLGDARILLFATHGLVAGALQGAAEPGLVLSPPAQGTAEDDGLLTASEIAALRLDADLVILSACSTATSDGRPRSEGLSGLARAFLGAGARSVVATHWAIPSQPTVEITTRMIAARQAESGQDWGRALQRAMLAMVDEIGGAENAHPANWGAFIAIGLDSRR
jgi:CHAT domain-containing protein